MGLLSNTRDVLLPLVYSGWVPDALVRLGIRVRLEAQLVELRGIGCQDDLHSKMNIVQELTSMPLAVETSADLANAQHYEVPAAFYDLSLGPRKKYSSGLWPYPKTTFEESEVYMLDLYCDRAGLEDGMHIVDLGCGWGSLTLHLAERFPNAKITGISNSHSQREYILKTAKDRGFNVSNINIVTVRALLCFFISCYVSKSVISFESSSCIPLLTNPWRLPSFFFYLYYKSAMLQTTRVP